VIFSLLESATGAVEGTVCFVWYDQKRLYHLDERLQGMELAAEFAERSKASDGTCAAQDVLRYYNFAEGFPDMSCHSKVEDCSRVERMMSRTDWDNTASLMQWRQIHEHGNLKDASCAHRNLPGYCMRRHQKTNAHGLRQYT
jgi:hypothetical protein